MAKKKHSAALEIATAVNSALKLEGGLRLGSDPAFAIERISSGSLVIDRITGGGFALGRHYELYGDESSGKSYIVYTTMAESQARGNLCALIDPEHSFDSERFDFLGGNSDELLVSHPDEAEQAVAEMMMLAKLAADGHPIEIISIDSVSSLVTKDEMSTDPREEDRIAGQARMMSRALRRITAVTDKTLFLWTNQERVDVGVRFGNPRVTSGGRALRFYATGRVEFRKGSRVTGKRQVARAGKLVESEIGIGRWTQVRVEKDKSTIPNREGAFIFNYEMKQIDPASEIIMLGLEDGLIQRSANGRYTYESIDGEVVTGTEKQFSKRINEDDELREEIRTAIEDNTRQLGYGGDDA